MRSLALLSFLIISIQTQAQVPGREGYDLWGSSFGENKQWWVYGNKVLVRNDSSSTGKVIDTVFLGDKVELLRKTSAFSTNNNIYAPWVEVKYGAGKKGYVWLGLMAFQQLNKGDTSFLYGLEKIAASTRVPGFEETKYYIGIKAACNNKLLDKKEWAIAGDESSSFAESKLLGNMGLANTHEILRINIGGEACGIPTNYYYHGWNGQRLLSLPGKYTVGDADVFYHSETLLFPAEKGGLPGYIIKLVQEEEMLEEETATRPARYKKKTGREKYVWNGEYAVKVK